MEQCTADRFKLVLFWNSIGRRSRTLTLTPLSTSAVKGHYTKRRAVLMKAFNGVDDHRYHGLVPHSDRFLIITLLLPWLGVLLKVKWHQHCKWVQINCHCGVAGYRVNKLSLSLWSPAVTLRTASLTFSNSTFCPHSVFMCFVWIWEQTAIISLYSINWLVFITETECLLRGTDWVFTYNSLYITL